jgi:YebC/PmpR family DNA-binding regulatory protein
MSGHSKWSTIKRKKAAVDSARSRVFTKLIREITVAAREGGGSEDANPRLRTAVQAARTANMPTDNIKRAIQKGTGELPGVHFEQKFYEGYGPGGVALLIEALTDNNNRTTGEVRHALTKHGGSMGELGSVAWMFEAKGVLAVKADESKADDLLAAGLDAGIEDLTTDGGVTEVTCESTSLHAVREALVEAGFEVESAEIQRLPKSTVRVEGKDAERVLKLMEALDELDDVQQISANFDIPDDILQEMAS